MQSEPVNGECERLDDVASLSLIVGRMLMEAGANARRVQEGIYSVGSSYGCNSVESFCQHAAIIVTLRRDGESCVQMGKIGEHGVNLRRSEAIQNILSEIRAGRLTCEQARAAMQAVPTNTAHYPVWFVCVATGLACCGFGRLLNADWASFIPTLVGTSLAQWLRHQMLLHWKKNIFITWGVVGFVAALIAGFGARWAGSTEIPIAMVAATLLLVPGVPILNAEVDVLDARPNLAAARALRVMYMLLFMTIGLAIAQWLVLFPM